MTIQTPDRLARLESMEGEHFWSVGRDVLTRLLITRHAMAEPILDAGAGTARFATELAAEGHRVLWFDIDPVPPPGFRASTTDIPLRSRSVGSVLARDVLEHVDDHAALAEFRRVLLPGGHLLVTVPGWPSLWGSRDDLAGHLRRYDRRGLRAALEGAGFDVVEVRGYQFLLLPIFILGRLADRRGMTRLEKEEQVNPWLNRLLTMVNVAEARTAKWQGLRPPTGSTIVAVARRR